MNNLPNLPILKFRNLDGSETVHREEMLESPEVAHLPPGAKDLLLHLICEQVAQEIESGQVSDVMASLVWRENPTRDCE